MGGGKGGDSECRSTREQRKVCTVRGTPNKGKRKERKRERKAGRRMQRCESRDEAVEKVRVVLLIFTQTASRTTHRGIPD